RRPRARFAAVKQAAVPRDWLWGWVPAPGIVSVWADGSGVATVWQRPGSGLVIREEWRFRPWLVLDRLDDLTHLGPALAPDGDSSATVTFRVRDGPGPLRFLVSTAVGRTLAHAVLKAASRALRRS